MQELIPISERNGQKVVSARELYKTLRLSDGQFARWSKKNIIGNHFAIPEEDYARVDIYVEGNVVIDYALVLGFAKKIAMLSQSEVGNQVREYFLECEKQAKGSVSNVTLPQSYAQALRELAESVEAKEALAAKLIEAAPKIEFYDAVTDSKDAIPMGDVAKVLNMGIGRNKLFQLLRDRKILMENNIPYQTFIDRSYFRTVERKWQDGNGETHIAITTLVFQRGVEFIRKVVSSSQQSAA